MRPFRFRAQAALNLRLEQEEKALRALGQARDEAEFARARTAAARGGASEADRQFQSVQKDGASGWLIGWHRSWIAKQRLEVDARKQEAAISAAAAERAAASVRDTHRKRRTLERLRDRSRRTYDLEVGRQDAREMNMLAGLRYFAQAGEQRGSQNDDRSHDRRKHAGGRRDDGD